MVENSRGKIYLVDEDNSFCQVAAFCLEQEGWQVKSFAAQDSPQSYLNDHPKLWILDADSTIGFDMLRCVKKHTPNVPVLLTADRENLIDRALGLELGCQDMVLKPFSPREMVLRVKRILTNEPERDLLRSEDSLQDYVIHWQERVVLDGDQPVPLTSKEFLLLEYLYRYRGAALSREQILEQVWGEGYYGSERVVDDLVRRMRRKLGRLRVETLYGFGYRLSM